MPRNGPVAEGPSVVQATENQQGLRYQLAGGDAAMAPDLSFLAVETVRVHLVSLLHLTTSDSTVIRASIEGVFCLNCRC